jgi:hypothetical protein
MKYRNLVIFITLFFSIVTFPINAGQVTIEAPYAADGFLDLRSWSFESSGPVKLDGGWDFYWGKLLTPGDFPEGGTSLEKLIFNLPSVWNDKVLNNYKLDGYGFATYRLRISIPENIKGEILALKIPYLFTSYRMWVNGVEASSNGVPGIDREGSIPEYSTQLYQFVSQGDIVDIVLQISNFHHNRGGMRASVTFGTNTSLFSLHVKNILFDMLILSALFIVGLYHIVLYLLWRKEKTHLLFGVLCMLFSLRTGFTGETILLSVFNTIPWIVHVKLEWFSVYFGPFLYITFLFLYFPGENNRIVVRAVQIFSVVLSAVTVMFNADLFTSIFAHIWFFNASIFFYSLYVLILAVLRKRKGSVIMLMGYIVPFITVLNDILYAKDIIHTGHYFSFGLFIFVFCYAFVLSQKNARSYSEVESLSSELVLLNSSLEQKVEERTIELTGQKKDLQEALNNVRTLKGLIPICSSCKKVRDDGGYWDLLESYFMKYSNAEFSHGICPECAKQLYPDIDLDKSSKK